MFRPFALTALFLSSPLPALAHAGHLGELAGHAHWLGLGAVVTAGALVGAIAKHRGKKNVSEDGQGERDAPVDGEAT